MLKGILESTGSFHIPYLKRTVFGTATSTALLLFYASGLKRDLGVNEAMLQRCESLSIVLRVLTCQGQSGPIFDCAYHQFKGVFLICVAFRFQANPSFQLTSIPMAQNLQLVVKVRLSYFHVTLGTVMPGILIGVTCFIHISLCISGEDSGKVMIWNMAPVLREEDEKNENVPKMLCQMDNHLGNCAFLCYIFSVHI